MKKILYIALFVVMSMGMIWAQTYTGNVNFVPNTDELGAHNDNGRGCAGCHTPHSGARGAGGNTVTGGTAAPTGTIMGDKALWATDLWPITTYFNSQVVNFADGRFGFQYTGTDGAGYSYAPTELNTAGTPSGSATGTDPMVSGIFTCLSCHDGNVSKGAMMTGISYEWAWGLLPSASSGANNVVAPVHLYGSEPIPTLLGNDGGALGDYTNDHPVGPAANAQRVLGGANGIVVTPGTSAIGVTPGSDYAMFVSNYGDPTMQSMNVDTINQVPYVTCTTCHNQHVMNTFIFGTGSKTMSGLTSGSAATYFFVNAPYNPGAPWTPYFAPSTTQFCRQCHFKNHANEFFKIYTVGTAY
jgi:hypothetical protein